MGDHGPGAPRGPRPARGGGAPGRDPGRGRGDPGGMAGPLGPGRGAPVAHPVERAGRCGRPTRRGAMGLDRPRLLPVVGSGGPAPRWARGTETGDPGAQGAAGGGGGGGQTSLAMYYLQRVFDPRRRMTVGVDIHVCPVEVDDVAVRLVVWDVGGQRRFAAVRDLFYRGAAAGALVFDLSNRLSFYQLLGWWRELRDHAGGIPLFLVGNKADLPREVSRLEAETLARAWGTPYFETSCLTGAGIPEFFRALARAALQGSLP
ncbi:MAG: hypothetical protein C4314_03250 [Thermoflexus sp.]